MRLIRHLPHSAPARPTAVAIGNFDGLHRGHRALVEACTARAPELAPAMLCFEPLPRTFFAPERPVPRVMKLRDRVRVASALGVELLAVLRFDRAFSMRSPAGFARDVLAAGLSARRVVVGEDFRFGHRAAGDVDALRQFGRELGFDVEAIPPVVDADGRRISSTRLRAALAEGDLDRAAALLGRRYRISGRVLRGKSLGRDLGFPTVNLRVAEPPALTGICAVRVHGAGLQGHPGVASLGKRPTVAGRDWLLEVHLIGYDGDLYGRHLCVDFVEWLRAEEHFESLDEMKRRMDVDLQRAKDVLDRRQ